MAGWQDAVRASPGGTDLLVEVAAGAKEARFPDGSNPWRDGRIGIRVRAAAQEGRANGEVVATVARFFGVPASRVSITQGPAGSRKTVHIEGLEAVAARRSLAARLGEA